MVSSWARPAAPVALPPLRAVALTPRSAARAFGGSGPARAALLWLFCWGSALACPPARDAEAQGDWACAVEGYRACLPDPYCAARLRVLEPQATDGFAQWSALQAVRLNWDTVDKAAAVEQIWQALQVNSQGPASGEMRVWLARQLPESDPRRAQVRAEVEGAAAASLADAERRKKLDREQAWAAGACALLGAAYLGTAAARWRRFGAQDALRFVVGWVLLALVPAGLGGLWGEADVVGLLSAGTAAVLVGVAGRVVPVWLVPGAPALVLGIAWSRGWWDSLGLVW